MNVNVTYSGYTLADAASCVMMRLPVPDLVWDMEVLWKVWNEPLPAIEVPEAVPEPAPEPVRRRGGECFAAKPVTYAGKEYPSVEALSRATGINSRSWLYRIRHNIPLDAPWGKGGRKRKAEPEPKPDNTEAVRQAATALPPKPNRYADEGNGRRLRDCPCELDGRQYTSLDTAAVILDLTLGEAYRQVMESGKFLKGRAK